MTKKINKAQLPDRAFQLYGQQLIKDNDFPAFCRLFIPEENFPYEWYNHLDEAYQFIQDKDKAGILAPRGHGKSVTFKTAFVLFEAIKNPNINIAIASNTESTVEEMIKPILDFATKPKIKAVFGELVAKAVDNTIEFRKSTKSVTNPEPTISVYSAKSGKIIGKHFDLIIVDDIVTLHNSQTPHGRKLTLDFYTHALLPTLRTNGRLLILGTRYNPLDLYGHLIKTGFPFLVQKAISNSGQALCPQLFTVEKLKEIERSIGKIAFSCQFQNDASLIAEGNLIKPETMQYYQDRDSSQPNYISLTGLDFRYIQSIDLAVGGKTGDYSVTAMIAFNTKTRNIYVVSLVAKRCTIAEFKQVIRQQYNQFQNHYPTVYCEANGFQTSILQDLNTTFKDMRIQPVKNTVNKYSRFIGALTPVFDDMRIYFNQYNSQNALIEEQLFSLTPTGSETNDDIPDSICQAIEHLPKVAGGVAVKFA